VTNLAEALRQRLEAVFAQYGLNFDEYVIFIPWLNGRRFDGLLERADVFLDTIGFSAFNTAMASGGAREPDRDSKGGFCAAGWRAAS